MYSDPSVRNSCVRALRKEGIKAHGLRYGVVAYGVDHRTIREICG